MAQLNDLLSNITNIKNDIKQAIINKGQTVTNFASYPNAILNIQSGGYDGDILLYKNIPEMQASVANDGDLALVYDINTNNLQALWQGNTKSLDDKFLFYNISNIDFDIINNIASNIVYDSSNIIRSIDKQFVNNILNKMNNDMPSDRGYLLYIDNNDDICVLQPEIAEGVTDTDPFRILCMEFYVFNL